MRAWPQGACLVAIVVALLACSPALAAAAPSASGPGCSAALPVVAHHAGGRLAEPPAGTALPLACATETGYPSSESTLGVTNTGTIVYSPAETENSLARSLDSGASWSLSYPPDEQYTSLWNTDDPYLVVDRRTGRVFWSHATGPTRTTPVLVSNSPLPGGVSTVIAGAYGFQVYTSKDDGRSFTTADYQTAPMADWEKVFVGPPPAAGAQPSGYPDVVYICANSPFEVSGPGRLCYRSLDGGTTFAPAGYVFPSASTPGACSALNTNNAVVASDGSIYHPITCQNGAYLAISHDEGTSYSWLRVPNAPPGGVIPGGALQVTIDQADNLYALWAAGDQVYVEISRDRGQSWGAPLPVAAPGVHNVALPVPAAGASGQLAVAYYATRDASAQTLSAYITQTHDALDAQPLFYSGTLNDPARPIFRSSGLSTTPRADYVGGSYDSSGTFWAGVVKQVGAPDANGNVATTGLVGRLAFTTPTSAPRRALLAGLSGCAGRGRLSLRITAAPGRRVVSVVVYANGRRVASRHGHDVRHVSIVAPRRRRLVLRIVTTDDEGGRAVATRTPRACGSHRRVHARFTG